MFWEHGDTHAEYGFGKHVVRAGRAGAVDVGKTDDKVVECGKLVHLLIHISCFAGANERQHFHFFLTAALLAILRKKLLDLLKVAFENLYITPIIRVVLHPCVPSANVEIPCQMMDFIGYQTYGIIFRIPLQVNILDHKFRIRTVFFEKSRLSRFHPVPAGRLVPFCRNIFDNRLWICGRV